MLFIKISEKKRFVIKYVLQAFVSLMIIFGGVILFKELYFDHDPEYWIEKFYGNNLMIYLIYVASEILFGIFPPELFMIWSFNAGDKVSYILNTAFFAVVSVIAGHIAYWGGFYLSKIFGKKIKRKYFVAQYLPVVKKYGGLLIVIAAFTPLPWATISLMMGVINYNYRKYTLIALSRILRFAIYGFIIFKTGSLFF
jgi:membrane protein DedA with SNARE-associated domain